MFLQAVKQLCIVGIGSSISRQHDDICGRQTVTMSAETLAHDALQAVSSNGPTHASLRDRQAEPWLTGGIVAEQHSKKPVTRSPCIAKNPVEFPLRKQAVLAPESSGGLLGFVHFPGFGQWRSNTPVGFTGPAAIGPCAVLSDRQA